MHRFYEWIKVMWREKINIFIKGASGGWFISGIFLFGSSIGDKGALLLAYIVKVFAVLVTGLLSGYTTVLGNDFYHWTKSKILNKKAKRKRQNNESKSKIKRAS